MNKRRQWTETDKQELTDAVRRNPTLHAAFIAVAQTTGHPYKSVVNLYYRERGSNASKSSAEDTATSEVKSSPKRWTTEEEQCLVKNVKANVNNLKKAFIITSSEIERTICAISAHWYAVTSKRKDVTCFMTVSEKHISRNRKNGVGIKSNPSIWRRLLRVIQNVIH